MTAVPTTSAGTEADPFLALPPDDVPFEGVPVHLEEALRDWIRHALQGQKSSDYGTLAHAVGLRLQVAPDGFFVSGYAQALVNVKGEYLLHVVRAILQLCEDPAALRIDVLRNSLAMGGSVYTVTDSEPFEIVRRIHIASKAARDQTIANAPTIPADHLREAWGAAFGLEPDPNKAYAEAVKAVEAVAIPNMCPPGSTKATLGNVLTILRGAVQAKTWQLGLPDQNDNPASVETVTSMVELLWHGRRSGHAGTPSSRPQTQAEAEHAVMLAVLLVRWFSTGFAQKV